MCLYDGLVLIVGYPHLRGRGAGHRNCGVVGWLLVSLRFLDCRRLRGRVRRDYVCLGWLGRGRCR